MGSLKAPERGQEELIVLTKDEFQQPITDEYAHKLAVADVEDIVDDYNPGSTNPDGTINFECHCMSHMVASPCGYAFRDALSCQRAAGEDNEKCADEFMTFMQCVVETECFAKTEKDDSEKS